MFVSFVSKLELSKKAWEKRLSCKAEERDDPHETALPVSLAGSDLNDGLWHSVSINARRNRVTLTLDNDAASPTPDTSRLQIYSGNSYYFGGKFPSL